MESLEKSLSNAPVETLWDADAVEVRPHGSSSGLGLMHQLTSEEALLGGEYRLDEDDEEEESNVGAGNLFDFVLCVGNFSARDEDIFVKLHESEVQPRADLADEETATGTRDGDDVEGDSEMDVGPGRPAAEGDTAMGDARAPSVPTFIDHPGAAGVGATGSDTDAPVLGLEGNVDQGHGSQILAVGQGCAFTVTLGNRSTQARYFLSNQTQVSNLLTDLASISGSTDPSFEHGAATSALGESRLPNAMDRAQLIRIQARLAKCLTPAFCLDFDGTLTPIVDDPDSARLPPGVDRLLQLLSDRHPTAIVSGRAIEKLQAWIDVPGLYFAGSHGFEIRGPNGSQINYTVAAQLLPEIARALDVLRGRLEPIEGVQLEDNKFVASVHTRNVSAADLPRVNAVVDALLEEQPLLSRHAGIHVIEVRPQIHWHKGKAMSWLIKCMCQMLGLPSGAHARNETALPIYIGDDVSDEDAFAELRGDRGIPIIVRAEAPLRRETAAEFWLRDPAQVADFLSMFLHT